MERIFTAPWRVYLCALLLCILGIWAGLKLPVSLFPDSSKPEVAIEIPTYPMTGEEFLQNYGSLLEGQILSIKEPGLEVEKIESEYSASRANIWVSYKWGSDPVRAFKETERIVNAFSSRLPSEIRDSVGVWQNRENSGFFAVSFYSDKRNLNEIYDILDPAIMSKMSLVQDAESPYLYNPSSNEISVNIKPEALAAAKLLPNELALQIRNALKSYAAGSMSIGQQKLTLTVPRIVSGLDDIKNIPIFFGQGFKQSLPLSRLADIDIGPNVSESRVFKTSGLSSLILFASPKPNGNIKKMSEDMLKIIKEVSPSIPKDIQYKVLVDPSEFIRNAIRNVFNEVAIAAFLASLILFLFIGNLRNVATAAIEIPLSMILAFILMKLFGVNLNLISMGGLALSAGMNVDASVVVMENIFRHFELNPGKHSYLQRLKIISQAVKEVQGAVISATIASLVVFLPLIFTTELSQAILGDLAKAIIFSHGCSVFVALLLVPTIRLHIMKDSESAHDVKSPIEKPLVFFERIYLKIVATLIEAHKTKWLSIAGLCALLTLSLGLLGPKLKRELVAKPDTDWIMVMLRAPGSQSIGEMKYFSEEVEAKLLAQFGQDISYTFMQVQRANGGHVMARLKDKKRMEPIWKAIEKSFPNTPFLNVTVFPWNPSEFDLPDPPSAKLAIKGNPFNDRVAVARDLKQLIESQKLYDRVSSDPKLDRNTELNLVPKYELIENLQSLGKLGSLQDLSSLPALAMDTKEVDYMRINGRQVPIRLSLNTDTKTVSDIGALPLPVGSSILPLKALFEMEQNEAKPPVYRIDQRELIEIVARLDQENLAHKENYLSKVTSVVDKWKTQNKERIASGLTIEFLETDIEMNSALKQLSTSVALSIALIFLILIFQFGNLRDSLLVLIAIPLGLLGACTALFVLKSTLSLNSVLGVILLNGISVANSILLVDFVNREIALGKSPKEAALSAAHSRLRPILITSLTTILGMTPIALGLGEGGKVLQPLGIAVSGGLCISMLLTIVVVPVLHASLLQRALNKKGRLA